MNSDDLQNEENSGLISQHTDHKFDKMKQAINELT